MSVKQRIHAHDSSVTVLQFDPHFLVTGGSDGKVKLFESGMGVVGQSGAGGYGSASGYGGGGSASGGSVSGRGEYVRDLTNPVESVWKVCFKNDVCVICCKRWGKTVIEIWSFRPEDAV